MNSRTERARQIGMHGQRHAVDAHHADRSEILERIVGELLHQRVDGELRSAGKIERVAVSGGARCRFGADDAPAPPRLSITKG